MASLIELKDAARFVQIRFGPNTMARFFGDILFTDDRLAT